MNEIRVKDVMVPLERYATVPEDATLNEAVVALEKAQQAFDQTRYRHRAVLIRNRDGRVVGKLSQLDVLRGLESKYFDVENLHTLDRFGLGQGYLKSIMGQYELWDKPLREICRKAREIKVKDIMYTPTEGEYVSEDATLDEAIHQLIMGHHQSLLVLAGQEITGVLRLTDVFGEVCRHIHACELRPDEE